MTDRVEQLAVHALAAMDPAEFTQRQAYCERTGDPDVSVAPVPGADLLEVRWAGRTLVLIQRAALDCEVVLVEHLGGVVFAEGVLPGDTVPSEWCA